jgi:hypothetical protein
LCEAQEENTMSTIFSLRLDDQSRQNLEQLARDSFRSRGGVIRWLIHYASLHHDLLTSAIEIPDKVTNPNETRMDNHDESKGCTL